jgi:CDP-paratose 2-epimerase
MKTVIVTGAGGLIGAEAVRWYAARGWRVVGIDNDMRAYFFGPAASTRWQIEELKDAFKNYQHVDMDIRDAEAVGKLFHQFNRDVELIIHTAAQPSHDWAATDPMTDFTVNANGTLALLEALRTYSPEATFIFTSTNKVYGDTPNRLPLVEHETRWKLDPSHPYAKQGIDEHMSIDQTKHSVFGASKVAADVMVQEYGRYFGLKTGVFRGGCLTGPGHSGAELHGFLAYLMKCVVTGTEYRIFGYKGKQVRDNIHSRDLISAFDAFQQAPRSGEVYNMGGGTFCNCSMIEAIALCEEIAERKLKTSYVEESRIGDHIWWISDIHKFQSHYPDWNLTYDLERILVEIHDACIQRSRTGQESGHIEKSS